MGSRLYVVAHHIVEDVSPSSVFASPGGDH